MRRRAFQKFISVLRVSAALFTVVALDLTLFAVVPPAPAAAADAAADPPSAADCASPANEIVAENCKPGAPASQWDVSGSGDADIQGFATDISVNQGETVTFKIDTTVPSYRIDIYRLGYYGGDGARLVDSIPAANTIATEQPDCKSINGTVGETANDNLVDCGNWSVSATWAVPADAVSGIYIARPTAANGDASHIVFIVRDDSGHSELLFQTSDTTWQAYNRYGEYSLYDGPGHAHKVSYNRPFTTRNAPTEDWLFNAEYPMVRWLERNGYDVSYFTDVDAARSGAEILEHETFMSVGHDEYWSAEQRANVTAARDAGVNLAFFSSNEIYWKTRFEPSTISSGNDYRTLVSYKEGSLQGSEHYQCMESYTCDPDPTVWTGLWRETTTGHDGGLPENALSGQISWGNMTTAIEVPAADTALRFWRNTGMTGDTSLTDGSLGYEIDWEQAAYASWYPAGRITFSETNVTTDNIPVGPKTHKISLYRATSGALVLGIGSAQWSWGLDSHHDRDASTEDPRIQQATVNMLSDMGAQPGTLQNNLVVGGPLDTSAPTASITAPLDGATVAGGNVLISGTASDIGGHVAGIEVSTNGGATWVPASGTTNWSSTIHVIDQTVTVMARAIDDSANIGAPSSIGITVGTQTCPCSIFASNVTGVEENDATAGELGVKFQSEVAGFITGIRFYKTAENTGIHTGTLWSSLGTNMGTATFSDESASGWQEVTFGAPIAIEAYTTYVASYHTNVGHYAIGNSLISGVDSPPLHALANGVDGPNGVYAYGPGGTYPSTSYESSNYLVDVVFVNSVGPDTTPPSIATHQPASSAVGVAVGANVTTTFNEAMAPASISGTTVQLRDPSNNLVAASVSYTTGSRTAALDPTDSLAFSTTYRATVKGGIGGVSDVAGNALAQDVTWTFTTAASPPPQPSEGPGGPILVVSSAANPFSRYYTEILRNEGLNSFYAVDLTAVDATLLAGYDVVILGEVAIDPAQAAMLATWVDNGGNLIAMRPDPDLAALLGLTPTGTTLSNAYVQIDTAAGKPGSGLVNQTIQFHGTADRYALTADTVALATLYSNATTSAGNAAVTLRSVGSNGGQVAAFAYDLARSVVYTRQGNPDWAGTEHDGEQPAIIRADDMFFPDWIDFNKVQIPQADEQQRLLANLIEYVNRDQMPLPRFWYFPNGEKAVVVMTGDDHGNGGTSGQFDWDIAQSPVGCDVADWECVRGTSYMYPSTPISNTAAAAYEAMGFELSVHVETSCADWTPTSLASFYSTQLAAWLQNFPSLTPPATHRTHCITWSDWATQPKVELSNGIRLDTNYYYWPDAWLANRPGFFTGSGMPMRFADLDGSMIDVYQAATQMTDESGITYSTHINTLLDNALGTLGYYGVVTTNMHTDNGNHPGQQTVVAAALARGVPVVSAKQMLTWLDGRNASSFQNLTWNAGTLSFSIAAASGSNGLQAMLPTQAASGSLQALTVAGAPIPFATQTVKGVEYAVFAAGLGTYVATYASDTTPPAINAVHAAPGIGTATITWTTDEPASSRVDYGTSATSLNSFAGDPVLTATHELVVTGLAANTTYYFRVTSVDGVGLTTVDPIVSSAPFTFVTPGAVATDTTVADFTAGTTGGSTYVSDTSGGEVTLAPTVGTELSGTTLPAAWTTGAWSGGVSTVANGHATIDGSWIRADDLVGIGRAIEFVATFSGDTYQNAGFGVTLEDTNSPWAMFGTKDAAGTLLARTLAGGGTEVNVPVGSQYIGSSHLFRIEWDTTSIRFFIDGTLVHTAATISGTMRPIASDFGLGGGALSLDWMRMTPYSSTGTFLSRIHDAGGSTNWGALAYVAAIPASTSLSVSVRTGATPTPDATWTAFAPIASGDDVATSGRYLQYRVDGTSATGLATPTLASVTISYSPVADTTPPTIVGRTPAPNAMQIAIGTNVNVAFDEPINAATVTTSTVTLRADGASSDVPAVVTYNGTTATLDPTAPLATSTKYAVTVAASVADTAGNLLGSPDSWTFTTSAPLSSLVDTTAADFGAGSTDANTYVSLTDNGEVTLAPAAAAEFEGTTLPAGWAVNPWSGGGSATVANGNVVVNEALLTTATLFSAGRSLEFEANFSDPNQHIGFANDFNSGQWAIFSTGRDGDQLYARSNLNPGGVDIGLGTSYLDGWHLYRIEWTATSVRYLIDGQQVALHTGLNYTDSLRPAASDSNASGSLAINWMRMSPYATSGTFTSRVLDAGMAVDWRSLDITASIPGGTAATFEVRTGSTPTVDGTWSTFMPATAADDIDGTSRYIQYRVALSTSSVDVTPVVQRVSIGYILAEDETPPTITTKSPTPNAADVALDASVNVSFSEGIDPATVTSSSVQLSNGVGEVAATLYVNGSSVILVPNTTLDPHTTYTATIATAVTDLAGNHLAAMVAWSFTTDGVVRTLVDDQVIGEYGAGTTDASTYVSTTANGEVILAPTVGAEFTGTSLPSGWSTTQWTAGSGTSTVGSGNVVVDGSLLATDAQYGPGRSLEFVATFGATHFEHVGFGVDVNNIGRWAMFSTNTTSGELFARTNNDGTAVNFPLAAGLVGTPHLYRIDWLSDKIVFSIDGTVVHTEAVAITGTMRPLVSDYDAGGPGVTVDWLRMGPYAGNGVFTSRILDAGVAVDWRSIATTQVTPAGTAITFEVRTGDTSSPDGSWTDFTPVTPGADIAGTSRFIQYRATLTTSDLSATPSLERVSIGYVVPRDETPPTISSTLPTTDATGVAVAADIDVIFSEAVDPVTVNVSSINLQHEGVVIPATLSIAGGSVNLDPLSDLAPYTAYTATVTNGITDLAGNHLAIGTTWAFTTGAATTHFVDDQVAGEFGAGTVGTSTYVSQTANGEVILAPAVGTEFEGSALPTGWSAKPSPWTSGGTAAVAGGNLSVDGTMAATTSTFGPGHSLEFVATFQAQAGQHVGFVVDLGFNDPWAIVSTGTSGNGVFARTNSNPTGVSLGAGLLGSAHRYRIDWTATGFDFYVDGNFATTIPLVTAGPMIVGASDFTTSTPLVVAWMRMSPYAADGTFESRVFDAGTTNDWTTLSATVSVPAGTSAAFETRSGSSANTSDASWSAWAPVNAGAIASPNARYLQYRAVLHTTDVAVTPVVERVELTSVTELQHAPTITSPGSQSSAEGATISLAITAGDVDGDTLTYSVVGLPTGLSINPTTGAITGTLGYASAASYTSTVTASDGTLSASATFNWTVTDTNRPPTAVDQTVVTNEDTAIAITLAATDPDANTLTYTVTTPPVHGALTGTGKDLTYTPAANYHGPDTFLFVANDGTVDSNHAIVSITVTSINDQPTITNPGTQTSAEGTTINLAIVATDVDGDTLTYTATGLPTGLSIDPATGSITGTFDYVAAGNYTAIVTVSDGTLSASATFNWSVTNTNRAPVAVGQTVTTQQNSAVAITLSATDVDGDVFGYTIVGVPAHGTLSGTAPNLTYTPDIGYHGSDSFGFTANDGDASNIATVSITVSEVESSPPPPPTNYVPVVPVRLMESRVGEASTIDGKYWQTGQLTSGSTTELTVAGRADVPTNATAAVLTITVTEPTTPGFVTVFPCGTTTPTTSNLNYQAGDTIANTVIAKIGTDGKICLFTSSTTHLIVDLNGYYPAGASYDPMVPVKVDGVPCR